MSASVRSFFTAPSARGAGDDFSDARKRAASTKTANTFGSVGDNPAFDEGGDYHDTPWWDTDFLEPPVEARRWGKRAGGARDRYSGNYPLWPSLSHYVVMSFAVRNVVKSLERAVFNKGEKIGESCMRSMNVEELKLLADEQLAKAKMDTSKLQFRRVNTDPKQTSDHPGYLHAVHRHREDNPLALDTEHVTLTGRDVLNLLKHREKWQKRVDCRLRLVMAVAYWRTGKPLSMVRRELIRKEAKEAAEAKRNGEPPPPSVFGTDEELAALMPVAHEKHESIRVSVDENPSGEATLVHPEDVELSYLELLKHEMTRLDVHLASVRYHINLGIDYDANGNIIRDGKSRSRLCAMCAVM